MAKGAVSEHIVTGVPTLTSRSILATVLIIGFAYLTSYIMTHFIRSSSTAWVLFNNTVEEIISYVLLAIVLLCYGLGWTSRRSTLSVKDEIQILVAGMLFGAGVIVAGFCNPYVVYLAHLLDMMTYIGIDLALLFAIVLNCILFTIL